MRLVQCRICKEKFDRTVLKKDIDWVMPSTNFYYHKSCYDNWKRNEGNINLQIDDNEWISYIYDFLGKIIKVTYDYRKCENQRQNFIKKYHYTNKGIFFALKYYYEINKQDWSKAKNGIGIIPYIYQDSAKYWREQINKKADILETIRLQMAEKEDRPVIKVSRQVEVKEEWTPNWAEIEAFTEENE